MSVNEENITLLVSSGKSAKKKKKKDANFYEEQRKTFEGTFKENEFLTIPEALEAVNTRLIALLTSDVKSRKLTGVSRETMVEVLKTLKIYPKVLARRTNALWDILLPTEQDGQATSRQCVS